MTPRITSASTARPANGPGYGAFVISLDFELHWGVRDRKRADGDYLQNLLGARRAIPGMLALFAEYGIAATWATVGFLFARSREERERFRPTALPFYSDAALDPYSESTGDNEQDDPLHYASSLIEQIYATPGQEVATHTFSHYYCLEPGQTREAFAADLRSATAIALRYGVPIRSIVLPRNQWNPAYADVLQQEGILCYRGGPAGWIYRPRRRSRENAAIRAARWLDDYMDISGPKLASWTGVVQPDGLANVRSSIFLRPCSGRRNLERAHFERIRHAIGRAAVDKRIFHLWWHPHNFGVRTDENMEFLRSILSVVARYRDSHGLRSLSMLQVAETAKRLQTRASAA